MPWRVVLLSGPAGAGKTTVCRLGHSAMAAAWGHPAAAIDTDQLYFNVDARWELTYDDDRNAMVLEQAAQLAASLFAHGWPTVLICGNSLFDPVDTAPFVARMSPVAAVHHVSLAPTAEAVVARCAGQPDRQADALAAEVRRLEGRPHPGSARLDNSALTPEQTLVALAALVDGGAGRIDGADAAC
ncbi:hypothetical protein BIV57_15450 [Mangrovactinospora gilvigrisea]|uniref:ATP-binding protein n=1 Tax=Mangrovactinospora gilvigrisea TaxID=1428644 RepID=A0A1J7BCW8_9ACTN|nr:hypothetical protein BIV57_15450 [Mangrovactinospora gilvigrisea]